MSQFRNGLLAALLASATALASLAAHAETISGALAKAYHLNSELNSARAGVRVTDENVPIAKSGYRPTIIGSGAVDYSVTRNRLNLAGNSTTNLFTGSFGVQIHQTLFDGFQTTQQCRGPPRRRSSASDESLRNTEQNTLFNAASAYMDVIRDRQMAVLRERNLEFLSEQVRAARSRFEVGEGTRTDVAQAEASRSSAVATLAEARAQQETSEATYQQIVGEAPHSLAPAAPLAKLLPKSIGSAQVIAAAQHPAILANLHLVDAAGFSVKSNEGAPLPQLSANAGVSQSWTNSDPDAIGDGNSTSAGVGLQLTVPIYQAGRVSGLVRQSKELLGQARIQVDVVARSGPQAVTAAWSQYKAAVEQVSANRELVAADQLALNGVIEERNVGQRTTLDVLNQQADVIDAQINLATSERDAVVASYAILSAIGRLSPRTLALNVTEYQPKEHYRAVKDKWFGMRTPDGR